MYNTPTIEELEYLASIVTKKQFGAGCRTELYNVYNRLYNANKRPTACGQCLARTHRELMVIYNNEKHRLNG